MHRTNIGDYLAPEIKVTAFTTIRVMASSSQPFGEEGQAGEELIESESFIL